MKNSKAQNHCDFVPLKRFYVVKGTKYRLFRAFEFGLMLFLADDVDAVTQREDYGLHSRVCADHIVESDDAEGLLVLWERILADFAVPDHVVCEDETAWTDHIEDQVVVLALFALVCVHIYDVV